MKHDEELMMEYTVGNQTALEEIFQRYKKAMFNYALRLLNNRADAEDVVGEVFFVVTSQKYSYQPGAKFSTWLYTIAHNVCIDRIRKRRRIVFIWSKYDKDSPEYTQWDIPDTKNLPDTDAEKKDTAYHVKKAISRLPFAQKEALILKEYHNLRYEEISKVLHCSKAKVKILIFRARERLKKKLLPLIEEVR
ncbi:MAG: RNA polymerase sigma factor [Candidatus Omnitrophota bacterium]|nr:MAG: RNA polymerase sigma factor [Candidatus Omnitrophota bacterium]